ncbi:CCS5 [Auxenochlorella protothecoides x Auxenochlorella symbiontica]
MTCSIVSAGANSLVGLHERPGCPPRHAAWHGTRQLTVLKTGRHRNTVPRYAEPESVSAASRDSTPASSASTTPPTQEGVRPDSLPAPDTSLGKKLAGGALVGTLAVFLAARGLTGPTSLEQLKSDAVDLDIALTNGKPTLIEFYADWCKVCQEMAPVLTDAMDSAASTAPTRPPGVNLVMLNIDNSRWTQERRQYHVRGVPQYQFLDGQGRAKGALIGKIPGLALVADLEALKAGEELPFLSAAGDAADLDSVAPSAGVSPLPPAAPAPSALPRDHS